MLTNELLEHSWNDQDVFKLLAQMEQKEVERISLFQTYIDTSCCFLYDRLVFIQNCDAPFCFIDDISDRRISKPVKSVVVDTELDIPF